MILLNAGVPRSGTVLVNAILRQILDANEIPYTLANPHGPELPELIHDLQRSAMDRYRVTLVHTHSWDADTAGMLRGSPFVTGFINYRDPRDVCVSLMRLHDHDFDTAARMVLASFSAFEAAVRDNSPMVIPYEMLTADRQGHIFQIAQRLGFWPGMETVARIDAATSIGRHRTIMERVRSGEMEGLAHRRNTNRVLAEDPKTLINDRHIQSGASGRWRAELPEHEQHAANERFADLIRRYGYAD